MLCVMPLVLLRKHTGSKLSRLTTERAHEIPEPNMRMEFAILGR
jgi:hypothetical protein